jgi:hypothetical protein
MDNDTILGIFIIASAISIVTLLVLYSRKTINRMSKNGYHTARHTLKELNVKK